MIKEQSVRVIIATHKKYQMPNDSMYIPLHVGAEGKKDEKGNPLDLGYIKDNTGDNISSLNASFCELTGLYWAWKNLEADYIGLAHYRRYLGIRRSRNVWVCILTYNDIKRYLGEIKLFVPQKRKYYIETLYTHYAHTHYSSQLDETRTIIEQMYPDYLADYDIVVKRRCGYMFNMMIMRREELEQYCKWLFDILFALQKRIDMPELSAFQGRFYGRISEIIFNVWLEHQIRNGSISRSEIKEFSCIYIEKVNWIRKGIAFLKAKFLKKKYEGSF